SGFPTGPSQFEAFIYSPFAAALMCPAKDTAAAAADTPARTNVILPYITLPKSCPANHNPVRAIASEIVSTNTDPIDERWNARGRDTRNSPKRARAIDLAVSSGTSSGSRSIKNGSGTAGSLIQVTSSGVSGAPNLYGS